MKTKLLLPFLLCLIPALSLGQGFDENYEVRKGDFNGDGLTDLYIRQKPQVVILHGDIATPIVIPAPVKEFVLRQQANKELVLVTNLSSSQKIRGQQWPIAEVRTRLRDANVDGNFDLVIEGIKGSIPDSFDQIVFSGSQGDGPFHITAMNEAYQDFYSELSQWMLNPNFFDESVPIRVVDYTQPATKYFGSLKNLKAFLGISSLMAACKADARDLACGISTSNPSPCLRKQEIFDENGESQGVHWINVCTSFDWHVYGYEQGKVTLEADYSAFNQDALETSRVLDRLNKDCPAIPTRAEEIILEDVFERVYGGGIFKDGGPLESVVDVDNHIIHAPFPGDEIFDETDVTYHHYDVLTKICDSGSPNCNKGFVKSNALRYFSYPSWRLEPTYTQLDGESVLVYISPLSVPETFMVPGGTVTQHELQGTWRGAIQNITEVTHVVYPGTISRVIMNKGDALYSLTHGVGVNKAFCSPYAFKPIHMLLGFSNDVFGAKAFNTLDSEMKKYWEENY
ncbi:hypothetical protein [Microbulbifer sp.]|uniref:hypothetical protein n=1 Tax=Microbulbifer sp. TaxID=1908541 RepID=UPI003F2ACEE7